MIHNNVGLHDFQINVVVRLSCYYFRQQCYDVSSDKTNLKYIPQRNTFERQMLFRIQEFFDFSQSIVTKTVTACKSH